MLERADWTTQPFHVYDLADMYDAYRLLDLGMLTANVFGGFESIEDITKADWKDRGSHLFSKNDDIVIINNS